MPEMQEITGEELQEHINKILEALANGGINASMPTAVALLAIGIAEFRVNGADRMEVDSIVAQIWNGQQFVASEPAN